MFSFDQIQLHVVLPNVEVIDMVWLANMWEDFVALFTDFNIGLNVENGVSCTGAQVLPFLILSIQLPISFPLLRRHPCICVLIT